MPHDWKSRSYTQLGLYNIFVSWWLLIGVYHYAVNNTQVEYTLFVGEIQIKGA